MKTVGLTHVPGCVRRRKPRRWLGKEGVHLVCTTRRRAVHVVGKAGVGYALVPYVVNLARDLIPARNDALSEATRMKKKVRAAAAADVQHLAAMESNVLAKCAGIIAHCAVTKYDDGDQRKPGWVTIKTMGSAWVIEAKDPDTCSVLRVVQATLDDALALLTVLLESDEAPWEHDTWLQQQAVKSARKK